MFFDSVHSIFLMKRKAQDDCFLFKSDYSWSIVMVKGKGGSVEATLACLCESSNVTCSCFV